MVITGKENIEAARLLTIRRGLMLEIKTGMKHSRNANVNAAKHTLQAAGNKYIPRNKKALLAYLEAYMTSLGIPFNP